MSSFGWPSSCQGSPGLYFTVQAVIDDTSRREFFSQVSQGLEQAVGVRKVYVAVRAHLADAGDEVADAGDEVGAPAR